MSDIHARAKQGIKLLMGRQVLLQILTFGGGIVLARVLGPAQFGLYAISTFLVSAFALLGDFGLAPSFIQRKEELTELDLRVGFTLQQIITTVIVAVLFVAAPWLAHLYPKAPPETVWLVRTLAFSLYLTSWRSMSALQLERHMRYDRLAWIEVVETLSYQGLAVGLAVTGHGVWSFVWATLCSGTLGAFLMYRAAPWRIRLAYDKPIMLGILRFGVPFQMQTIAISLGNWVTPVLVGGLIGPQAVGLLTWASSNGKKPTSLMDSIKRVSFPHFSRIQEDTGQVCLALEKYLAYIMPMAGFWLAAIYVAGPLVVQLIYGPKWVPAVSALTLYAVLVNLEVITSLVGMTMISIGRVNLALQITVVYSLLNLLSGVLLVSRIGYLGVPIAQLICTIPVVFWTMHGVDKRLPKRVMSVCFRVGLAVVVSCLLGKLINTVPMPLLLKVFVLLTMTFASYFSLTWLTSPLWLKDKIVSKVPRASRLSSAV